MGDPMTKKLWAAFALFLLLTLSTLAYAGYIAFRTYQIETDEGTTVLIGSVKDSSGQPVEGARVSIDDHLINTGTDGSFRSEEVDVGVVRIEIYKEGYVPLEFSYLAYPKDDVKNDLEGSINNISTEHDLELSPEMITEYPFERIDNGTASVRLSGNRLQSLVGRELSYGNGTGDQGFATLKDGDLEFDVIGDGTVMISVENETEPFRIRVPPGTTTDITDALGEFYLPDGNMEYPLSDLRITVKGWDIRDNISLVVIGPTGESQTSELEISDEEIEKEVKVREGIAAVRLHGRSVRDVEYADIVLKRDNTTDLVIEPEESGPEVLVKDLDLSMNYLLSGFYLLVGGLFVLGAYLVKKGKKWTMPFIIALLGFLIRGLSLGPVNVNLILASVIIILLFMSRDVFAMREKEYLSSR